MEILDKKLKQVSRANAGVSERREFPDLRECELFSVNSILL